MDRSKLRMALLSCKHADRLVHVQVEFALEIGAQDLINPTVIKTYEQTDQKHRWTIAVYVDRAKFQALVEQKIEEIDGKAKKPSKKKVEEEVARATDS